MSTDRGLWGLASVLRARRAAGLPPPHTQAELAAVLGRSAKAFSPLVSGARYCPPLVVDAVCGVLGCPAESLQPYAEGGAPSSATHQAPLVPGGRQMPARRGGEGGA